MDVIRIAAAIVGFGAFIYGALLAVDGNRGAASLLTGGAIVIASVLLSSAIERRHGIAGVAREIGSAPPE